jgi:hypothetical protein
MTNKRIDHIEPEFIDRVPDVLEPGVIYVSIRYDAVIHACCCGCGEKVATPLSPAEWALTYDGERISLDPSIGNGALACNSHYWITRNEVRWAPPLTKAQTAAAHARDQVAIERHLAPPIQPDSSSRPSWWRRLLRRV